MSVLFTRRGEAPSLGKLASDYEVGSSVFIPVNDVNTEFLVVHQGNPSTSLYDSSCNGTWLLMKDIYEIKQWHNSGINDYENSMLHSYLNNGFLTLFDANIQSTIKQVKVPYRPGSGTSQGVNSGENGLSCKIFLLSGAEAGFTADDYWPFNEGAKLSYFESGTGGSANNKRVAYLSGSVTCWWLRSPNCYNVRVVNSVWSNGIDASNVCSDPYGVRPALVLPNDTKFDPDTDIIK